MIRGLRRTRSRQLRPSLTRTLSTGICHDFRDRGTCRFGDACRFTHANPFRGKKAQSSAARLNETLRSARPSKVLAAWDASKGRDAVWNGVNVATALLSLSSARSAPHRKRVRSTKAYREMVQTVAKRAAKTLASATAEVEHGAAHFFGPRELASVARSVATLGVPPHRDHPPSSGRSGGRATNSERHRVFAALASGGCWYASEMELIDLTKLAWSFATARVDSPSLFSAIARAATPRVGELDGRQLSMLAWGFAQSGRGGRHPGGESEGEGEVSAHTLLSAVGEAATQPETLRETSARDLATTAWSLAIADAQHHAPAIAAAWAAVFDEGTASKLSWEEWTMMRQVQLAFDLGGAHGSASAVLADVPLSTQRQNAHTIERAWNEPLADSGRPSHAQREVSLSLRALGWSHTEELVVDEALGALDMGSQFERVGVEFDGPTHFLENVESGGGGGSGGASSERSVGPTLFKHRALKSLGWRCARVHYAEWLEAKAMGPGAADDLLVRKMESVGVRLR